MALPSGRKAGTLISCTHSRSIRRIARIWWRAPIPADLSPQSADGTTSSARNFTREEPKARLGADCEFLEVETVILFPAIDLKNGEAVRLQQGDMARATVFSHDPAAQAHAFAEQGFTYLHLVDLDGAFAGKPVNAAAVDRIL